MKVTMMSVMCGPEGNAFPGTVLDIPDKKKQDVANSEGHKTGEMPLAEYLIEKKYARPFDPQKDAKARQHGLAKAER